MNPTRLENIFFCVLVMGLSLLPVLKSSAQDEEGASRPSRPPEQKRLDVYPITEDWLN